MSAGVNRNYLSLICSAAQTSSSSGEVKAAVYIVIENVMQFVELNALVMVA